MGGRERKREEGREGEILWLQLAGLGALDDI